MSLLLFREEIPSCGRATSPLPRLFRAQVQFYIRWVHPFFVDDGLLLFRRESILSWAGE
jgi:hypothetical protein